MNICIASGKGGTGKTTLAVNLAHLLGESGKSVHLADCDVDAANAHLFYQMKEVSEKNAVLPKPRVNINKCTGCGACMRACEYNAITVLKNTPLVFDELCHSCGACSYVCPENAINYHDFIIGKLYGSDSSETMPFSMSWGELGIGQVQAPDMIRQLKQELDPEKINILDASPGAGCPVRETMVNSDVVILVTEPTLFGLNDLETAAELALQLGIPTGIIVNRSREKEDLIKDFTNEKKIPLIGRIPFKREYAQSYSKGDILIEKHPELRDIIFDIAQKITELSNSAPALPFYRKKENAGIEEYKSSGNGKPENVSDIVVMSGKGGTGKTTLSASFAFLSERSLFFDADVDASNMPILLKSELQRKQLFYGGKKAEIIQEKCRECGVCQANCRFSAIEKQGDRFYVISEACEGCGMCTKVCPAEAVSFERVPTGYVYLSGSEKGLLSHAFLNIGEENSGKLVTQVRDQAHNESRSPSIDRIIGDGPPGTGCPVIASTTGADLAIIVTEPTLSGRHDLMRALDLAKHFNLDSCVIINKEDVNPQESKHIRHLCLERKIDILGSIPFDDTVNKALAARKPVSEYPESPAGRAVLKIWNKLTSKYL